MLSAALALGSAPLKACGLPLGTHPEPERCGGAGAQAVTTEVSAVPGVETVEVDLSTGTVTISVAQPVDRADVVAAVEEAGYTASS